MTLLRKVKDVLEYVDSTSKGARAVTYAGLILTCALLFAALITLVTAGECSQDTYIQYHLVKELVSTGWLVLLISTVGAVCIEDVSNRQ